MRVVGVGWGGLGWGGPGRKRGEKGGLWRGCEKREAF